RRANDVDLHFVAPRQLDHGDEGLGDVDVAVLERAGREPHVRARRGRFAPGQVKQAVGTFREAGGVRVHEPDAVDHRERLRPLPERLHRDRAVGAHQDAARGRDGHRTAFTHDRVPGAGGQDAPRADPQVAGARIALAAVRALDRDEPLALDGDVEVAPRVDDGALREARRVRPDHGVDPRGEPGSGDRLRAEGVQVGAEAGRRGVREIVAVDGLRVFGLLRAGHREVDHPVHACNARPCDQRMLMTVWVTASAVEITCALAWKFRWAVIILTSCAVRSTLDDSSAPDWTLP